MVIIRVNKKTDQVTKYQKDGYCQETYELCILAVNHFFFCEVSIISRHQSSFIKSFGKRKSDLSNMSNHVSSNLSDWSTTAQLI